jgi:hypothetical protein
VGVAYNDRIYTSSDSGATWQSTSAPVKQWVGVASSADGTRLVATAYSDRIYVSQNSGATWTATGAASTPWWTVIASADGSKLVAADSGSSVSGGGIYTSQSTPTPVLRLTSSGGTAALSWTVPSTIFTLQQNSDLNTTNWTDVTTAPTLNTANLQNQVIVSPLSDNQFYRLKH